MPNEKNNKVEDRAKWVPITKSQAHYLWDHNGGQDLHVQNVNGQWFITDPEYWKQYLTTSVEDDFYWRDAAATDRAYGETPTAYGERTKQRRILKRINDHLATLED